MILNALIDDELFSLLSIRKGRYFPAPCLCPVGMHAKTWHSSKVFYLIHSRFEYDYQKNFLIVYSNSLWLRAL